LALALNEVPGGTEAVDLLMKLAGVEDAQLKLLKYMYQDMKDMRQDLEIIRLGPFRSAIINLNSAGRIGREDKAWEKYVTEASREFTTAITQAKNVVEQSHAEFGCGITCLLQGDRVNAQVHLALSSMSAEKFVDTRTEECVNYAKVATTRLPRVIDRRPGAEPPPRDPVLERGKVVAAVAYDVLTIPTWTLAVPKKNKEMKHRARKRIQELRAYLAFYNLTQYSRRKISTEFTPTYLDLIPSKVNSEEWALRAVSNYPFTRS
jgi:hypothetical protein